MDSYQLPTHFTDLPVLNPSVGKHTRFSAKRLFTGQESLIVPELLCFCFQQYKLNFIKKKEKIGNRHNITCT